MLIGAIILISGSFVKDNLLISLERTYEPEDRGLMFTNISGFCNGTVILTMDNYGDHSIEIKDIILKTKSGYEKEVITSVNKEIPKKSSNVTMTVQFTTGSLQANYVYLLEYFTQRGSLIKHGPTLQVLN